MFRWSGKTALVTGASSGIGAAICKDLAKHGVNVIGLARREDNVKALADEMKGAKGKIYPLKADLGNDDDVKKAFSWIQKTVGPLHVLINNAGISILRDTIDGNMDEWRQMFSVNVFAPGVCIREYLKGFEHNKIDEGHIVNISSIVGCRVVNFSGSYVYGATKHALNVLTEGMRQEFLQKKMPIRISTICPGYVGTELFNQAGEYSQQSKDVLDSAVHLDPTDIGNAVVHILGLPSNVRVHNYIIQARDEFF